MDMNLKEARTQIQSRKNRGAVDITDHAHMIANGKMIDKRSSNISEILPVIEQGDANTKELLAFGVPSA